VHPVGAPAVPVFPRERNEHAASALLDLVDAEVPVAGLPAVEKP
jgi:hypothetical protein